MRFGLTAKRGRAVMARPFFVSARWRRQAQDRRIERAAAQLACRERVGQLTMDRALNGVDVPVYSVACPERLPWQAAEGAS